MALESLKRYADLAALLVKHGAGELLHHDDRPSRAAGREDRADGEELASDLERLGPTSVKLGQLLSSRADLLPPEYLAALERLRDEVEPFDVEDARRIIREDLGVGVSDLFSDFDERPLAAASLGQVHAARARDGRRLVVKVQRPDARERVVEDLAAFGELARKLDRHTEAGRRYRFSTLHEQLESSLLDELDYEREAANLIAVGRNLTEFDRLCVPAPLLDFTSRRVLTMERIEGTTLGELSPVVLVELPGQDLADELFRAYLHQVLVDGLFHADPHPGNLMVMRDRRIALVDLGMVGHVRPATQERLLKLLLALSDGDGDRVAETALRLSRFRERVFDREGFEREVGELVSREGRSSIGELEMGKVIMEITRISGRRGVLVSPELTMLGKTLLNLDGVAAALDPDFRPAEAVSRHSSELMNRRLARDATTAHLFETLIDSKELIENLPGRLDRILERLAEDRFRIRVDAVDERKLMVGLQKIANRITLGLVIASLVIGAGLMMRVETTFTIGGYPGLAMLCFVVAFVAAIGLGWSILRHDHSPPKDPYED